MNAVIHHFIGVTQADIDAGVQCDSAQCPVARAVRRHLPWADLVEVGHTGRIKVVEGTRRLESPPIAEVADFVAAFDGLSPDSAPLPFSFLLPLPVAEL